MQFSFDIFSFTSAAVIIYLIPPYFVNFRNPGHVPPYMVDASMRLSDAVHGNGPISVNLTAANHNGFQEGIINRNVNDRNNDNLQRNDSMNNNNNNNNNNNSNNNSNISNNNNHNNNNNNNCGKSVRSVSGGVNSGSIELVSAPSSPKPRFYSARDAEHLSNNINNYQTRNANFNIVNNMNKNEKGSINYHNNDNNIDNDINNNNNNHHDNISNNNHNNDNHNNISNNDNNSSNNNNNSNNIQYSNHPSRIPLAAYNKNTGIHDTSQIQGPYLHPHRTSHIGGINRTVTSQHSSNVFK